MKLKYSAPAFIAAVAVIASAMAYQAPKASTKSTPKKTVATPGKTPAKPAKASAGKDTITTASGLRYVITVKNPKGSKAAKGDQVEAHYTGTLLNGKKFDSSRDRNQTFKFVLGQGQVIKGWDEAFALLRTGEQARLIIPAQLGYGSQDMGEIPPNSTLVFDVELVSVNKAIAYTPYSGAGKDTITTASGLRYIVISKGNPKMKAMPGMMADMYYALYLMDGSKIDGNFGTFEPFKLPVVGGSVIAGWQEILPLMNKGMQVRALIPAKLAYGEKGYPGVIPPNAPLVFDMMMADLYAE